jgi:phage terminase large subunit
MPASVPAARIDLLLSEPTPGTSVICIREVQRVLAQSSKKLVDDTIRAHELEDQFEIQADRTNTPGGGLIIFNGMQDHTAESIKSLEGFDIAWVDEAQALSS